MSRSQHLGMSLLFTVMVLSVSERRMLLLPSERLMISNKLFFVGSVFDMPTDGKCSCSQWVGGTIGYWSWISTFQLLDHLTAGFCD